ncbi:hypothetical protein RA282_29300, partial [Pseudomonas syringae pv. tagetis]
MLALIFSILWILSILRKLSKLRKLSISQKLYFSFVAIVVLIAVLVDSAYRVFDQVVDARNCYVHTYPVLSDAQFAVEQLII